MEDSDEDLFATSSEAGSIDYNSDDEDVDADTTESITEKDDEASVLTTKIKPKKKKTKNGTCGKSAALADIMKRAKDTVQYEKDRRAYFAEEKLHITRYSQAELLEDGLRRKKEWEETTQKQRIQMIKFRQDSACKLQKCIISEKDVKGDTEIPKPPGVLSELKMDLLDTSFYPSNTNRVDFYTCKATPETYCMFCTLAITETPYPCPVSYRRALDVFEVEGQFCSLNCVCAYVENKHFERKPLFRHMCKQLYGIAYREQIFPTPDPYLMQKFGGALTELQFRNLVPAENVIQREMLEAPLIPFTSGLQQITKKHLVFYRRNNDNEVDQIIRNIRTNNYIRSVQTGRKIQKSTFAQSVDIEEQIRVSDQRVKMQMGLINNTETKKKRTLRDFLKKKS